MTPLLSLDLDQTRALFEDVGLSPVHAAPLRRALLAGDDPADTPRLPKRAMEVLRGRIRWLSSASEAQHDAEDGSTKHLVRLADGGLIETVHLPGARGGAPSACLSSQVGCAMGCRFCASGLDRVARNLEAHEYLEQVVHLRRRGPVQRIVFMGAGEPTQNHRNLSAALHVLRDEAEIGPKHVLVSTVGPARAVDRLTDIGLRFTLALSLHAVRHDVRADLIPTQRKQCPIELLDAADRFAAEHRRPYQVEYVLLGGVNDRPDDATALARALAGRRAHTSVIRWNPVPGMPFRRPDEERARAFVRTLHDAGLSANLRRTVGNAETAACGQLRSQAG